MTEALGVSLYGWLEWYILRARSSKKEDVKWIYYFYYEKDKPSTGLAHRST